MKNFDSVRQIIETRVFNIIFFTLTQADVDADNFNPNSGSTNTSPSYLFDAGITRLINNRLGLDTITVAEFQTLNPNRSGGGSYEIGDVFVINNDAPGDFQVFIEGRTFTTPSGVSFAILSIQDASVVGREFGNSKDSRLRAGSVRIKLFAPFGNGTKVIRDMADSFDQVLSYTAGDTGTSAGGTLFMKAGSLRQGFRQFRWKP